MAPDAPAFNYAIPWLILVGVSGATYLALVLIGRGTAGETGEEPPEGKDEGP